MSQSLAMIVWCKQIDPKPLPLSVIGVEVSSLDDGDGDPPLFVRPAENAPNIMFRLTTEVECPGLGAGFKLYGTGRWAAITAGGEDCGTGRAEPFAVTPEVAADVLNRLMVRGWMLSTCPEELKGIHERACNPKEADDLWPLSAATVEAVCRRKT